MSDAASIGAAIGNAVEYLTEHPDEARYTDSTAVASLNSGLAVTVQDPAGRTIRTDMPTSVGGGDTEPSPGWLFRAAIAACDVTLIAMRAAMLGVEVTDVQVTIDSEPDDRGIIGIDASVPAGPLNVRTRVRVTARGIDEQVLRELVDWAVEHCPVCDATKRAVPVSVEVEAG
jgi:uncharacterized OsmC-like protein